MYEDILPFALNLFYDLVICWFYDNSFIKIIPNGIGSIPERSFCQRFFQDFISKICYSSEFEIWYSFVSTKYSNWKSGNEWERVEKREKKHSEYTKHNENKETWLISNIKRMKLHSCVAMLSTIWIAGHWFLSGQSSPENQSTLIHPKGKYVLIIFQSAHTKKDKSILVRENSWTRKRANC